MSKLQHLRPGLVSVPLLFSAACMVSPFDGQVVSDVSDPIVLLGYHLDPGVELELEAYNPGSETFDPIASATSQHDIVTPAGDTLFQYHESGVIIPAAYWDDASCDGRSARVRTREVDSGRSMLSVYADWGACWASHDYDLGAFVDDCTSARTPEARLVTEDFAEFPPQFSPFEEDGVVARAHVSGFQARLSNVPSRISRVHMRATVGRVSRTIECSHAACYEAWYCAMHPIEATPFADEFGDDVGAWAQALNDHGSLQFRGFDEASCSNGGRWTDWTESRPWDYRPALPYLCTDPDPSPEPEPEPEYQGWNVTCGCVTQYGVGAVQLDVCAANDNGMAWQCQYLEGDFEALYGVPIVCDLGGFSSNGATCGGYSRTITSADVELFGS